ncbi:nucleotidyltransferase domain-containing protein, partial [bacterium]|nr:nucleotidyltransferase domain-containing protein [bacterium]
MNKTHIEILKEIGEERKKFFENFKDYSLEIKNKAKQLLGEVKVLVFGSVIKNSYNIVNSDIDILIISDRLPEKSE